MDLLFRILGVAARVTESLSRRSINFIPLHLALMAGCAVACVAAGSVALDGLRNAGPPRELTVARIVAENPPTGSYVRVTGELTPTHGLKLITTKKKSQEKRVSSVFVPLSDPGAPKQALLVQMKTKELETVRGGRVIVTGTLKSVPGTLEKKLTADNNRVGPFEVVATRVLAEGDTPEDPVVMGSLAGAAGLVALLMLFSMLRRYTIFRVTPAENWNQAPGAPGTEAFATGRFTLEEKNARKYFVRMPAVFGDTEDGNWAILANIDASSHFMGFRTRDRSGIWSISMSPREVRTLERGILYYGMDSLPSLRIRFEGESGSGSAIVSFRTRAEREELFRTLRGKAPQAQSGS